MAAEGTVRGEQVAPRGFEGLSKLASDVSADLRTSVAAVAGGMTREWPGDIEDARWATEFLYPPKHLVASALFGAIVAKTTLFATDDKEKARQLFGCAKTLGSAFLAHALEQGMVSPHPALFTGLIHPPDSALRLGYVLTAAAYGARNDGRRKVLVTLADWFKEVLARQQLAGRQRMSGLFSEIAARHGVSRPFPFMQPSDEDREPMKSVVESQHSSAEKAVADIIDAVRANARYPLQRAYGDLVAAFGGPGDASELERRYGAVLARLFSEARRAVANL